MSNPTPRPQPAADLYLNADQLRLLSQVLLSVAVVVISILALIPPAQVPLASLGDKVLHAGAFFTLAALADTAFPEVSWLKKFLAITFYGLCIEIAQSFVPLRTAALDDLGVDMIGQFIYLATTPLWKRLPVTRLRWS